MDVFYWLMTRIFHIMNVFHWLMTNFHIMNRSTTTSPSISLFLTILK
jgi:hypothetical protein